jgi:hypothetical protein
MNIGIIASKILSLENELEILRFNIKELLAFKKAPKSAKCFNSLYNILKGKGNFSEQEIKDAQIKLCE